MDELTASELAEWEAYAGLEPLETTRADYRMAVLASIVVNIARAIYGKKGAQMTSPEDFLPDWTGERQRKGQSVEEMKQVLLSIAGVNKDVK